MGKNGKNVRARSYLEEGLIVLLSCVFLFVTLFSSSFNVWAGVGDPNATVATRLTVGAIAPEVLNVSVEAGALTFDLTANTTTQLSCVGIVRDYNGEADIAGVNATFYDFSGSITDPVDNNNLYHNTSCTVSSTFANFNGYVDDAYTSLANCTFDVEYYANPTEWSCFLTVEDNDSFQSSDADEINITELLALGLPDTLDYGTVNSTQVSLQNITNVSNYGNVVLNLSLEGYAVTPGDGYAMNCSLGSVQNISIEHQKYNLTASNNSNLDLGQADSIYTNLTTNPVIRFFNLTVRQSDIFDDTPKETYWRMYVPVGVAGNCTGNIVFGATTATGS